MSFEIKIKDKDQNGEEGKMEVRRKGEREVGFEEDLRIIESFVY